MNEYQQEQAEKAKAIQALGLEVAKYLPDGWTLLAPRQQFAEYDQARARIGKGPLVFSIEFGGYNHKGRLYISSIEWPFYTSAERTVNDNGREVPQRESIGPHNLYNPKEVHPSITVSMEKSPEQVAKDITRRFIPEYERIYARCDDQAKQNQAYSDKTRDNWTAICKLTGGDVKWGHTSIDVDGFGSIRLERRGDSAKLEMDVKAETFAAILKLLKGE